MLEIKFWQQALIFQPGKFYWQILGLTRAVYCQLE